MALFSIAFQFTTNPLLQRKYDVSDDAKQWAMKDLDQKWRSWKLELRNKWFNPSVRANQQKVPDDERVNKEQWKNAVATWCNTKWKVISCLLFKNTDLNLQLPII